MRTIALAMLFATSSFAADKELKALNGVWIVEKFTFSGVDVSGTLAGVKLELADGKYSTTVNASTDSGNYTIDGSKTPKEMDLTGVEGPNKGKKYLCIYEIKDGTLTICYSPNDKRPTAFESPKDSQIMIGVYKKK